MNMFSVIPSLLLCLLLMGSASGQFVADGVPLGEFVLSKSAAGAEVFAVYDVQGWIQKITGAKVPILDEPSPKANEKVFVGSGVC